MGILQLAAELQAEADRLDELLNTKPPYDLASLSTLFTQPQTNQESEDTAFNNK